MPEITFIFKTDINQSIQYGKIVLGSMSDDHAGVDHIVKKYIYNAINSYLINNSLPTLKNVEIGVLGLINDWCSSDEQNMNMFQLYIDCRMENTYYYNGETGSLNFTFDDPNKIDLDNY